MERAVIRAVALLLPMILPTPRIAIDNARVLFTRVTADNAMFRTWKRFAKIFGIDWRTVRKM